MSGFNEAADAYRECVKTAEELGLDAELLALTKLETGSIADGRTSTDDAQCIVKLNAAILEIKALALKHLPRDQVPVEWRA